MLSILAAIAAVPDLAAELERDLQGKPLSGMQFHRTLAAWMKRQRLTTPAGRWQTGCPVSRIHGSVDARMIWAAAKDFGSTSECFIIWREQGRNRVQQLDQGDKGPSWGHVVYSPPLRKGNELIHIGEGWAGGNWFLPCIRLYKLRNGRWELRQALAPEEGESAVETRFGSKDGRINHRVVLATVRLYPDHLGQPHVGPLLRKNLRFERKGDRYILTRSTPVRTPLATLEELAAAKQGNDRPKFNRIVPKPFRNRLWSALKPSSNISTMSSTVFDDAQTLIVDDTLKIRFSWDGCRWIPSRVAVL